jgi:hypothetical protein
MSQESDSNIEWQTAKLSGSDYFLPLVRRTPNYEIWEIAEGWLVSSDIKEKHSIFFEEMR